MISNGGELFSRKKNKLTFLQLFLLVSVVAGVGAIAIVALFYEINARQAKELQVYSQHRAINMEFNDLEKRLHSYILAQDLLFASNQFYLTKLIDIMYLSVTSSLDTIETSYRTLGIKNSDYDGIFDRFQQIRINLEEIEALKVQIQSENGTNETSSALTRFDAISTPLVNQFDNSLRISNDILEDCEDDYTRETSFISTVLMGTIAMYLFLAILILRWLIRVVGVPIQNLIESAKKTIDMNMEFKRVDSRVMEVADLSQIVEDVINQLLHQKKISEAANKSKSVFLANMSHEIRTPMNAILGYSQILQRDISLTDDQRDSIHAINTSGEHLLALINDVLEMSKIEAGRITLNTSTFDLHSLVVDLEMMFRVRTAAKGINLSVEKVGPVPRFISSDESKIRQVLINIIGNAVKFTSNGEIVVRLSSSPHNDVFRIVAEVKDTGPGIAAEELGAVFQQFEQSSSGKKTEGSTGLGLSISREYARLMSGDITVESIEGEGSTFRLELLASEATGGTLELKVREPLVNGLDQNQGEVCVLVVDDVKTNRNFLRSLLTPIGFTVKQATNGLEAVQEFERWHPQIILMDIRMDVMDGLEATRQIRARDDGKDVVIIVLTASVFEEQQQSVLDAGANDFMLKPFRGEDLFASMKKHADLKYVYDAANENSDAAEERETSSRPVFSGVPSEWLSIVHDATVDADGDLVIALLSELTGMDKNASRKVRGWANDFRYDLIIQAIEEITDE